MRRRTIRSKKKQKQDDEEDQLHDDPEEEITDGKFFACYLLTSLCPRFKGHTYIGFTVNPQRRIKQHNGELRMGAYRTKRKRPWEMVLCVYGFPTNIAALQFEWAWQHPIESLAVRQVAATFKSLNGVGNKIKLAYAMLNLPSWQRLNMTVNFFSTKYKKHTASCPTLPRHMKVQVCSMDELSSYSEDNLDMYENDWEIEDDHVVGGSSGEHQNKESNRFPDLTSKNLGTLEGGSSRGTNSAEESNLEQYSPELYQSPGKYVSPTTVLCDGEEKDSNNSSGISSEVEVASCNSGSVNVAGSFGDTNVIKPAQLQPELYQESFEAGILSGDEGKHSTKSSRTSFEAEVIDLFTPSPSRTTYMGSKVIKPAQFHPEPYQPSKINFSATSILSDDEGKDLSKSSNISTEVEVIDLFTPSPCQPTNTGSRKRRWFSDGCPEIIDLTD